MINSCPKPKKIKKSTAKNKAWKNFSLYIRSKYPPVCYTCGKTGDMQCGHAIGGRCGAVLFDEELCRPQCVGCNVFLRGNYQIFITKLIKENGMEWWEKKLLGSKQTKKYSVQDYQTIAEKYKIKEP